MVEWSAIARRIRVPLGFALAVFYLWVAQPTWKSLAGGALVTVPGILLRALASGHVRKNQELTTTGPYAYTRNPLYLGSLVMAVGFAWAARSIWVLLLIAMMFFLIYLPVIRAEEAFLRATFPNFEEYSCRVPRLLPRLGSGRRVSGEFSPQLYWLHHEYNAVLGSAALIAALVAKLWWGSH